MNFRTKRKAIAELLKRATPVKDIPEDCIIIVQLAEGYDLEGDHKFWKLKANKSEIRDIACAYCLKQVVMSNKAYGDFIANGRKNKVVCAGCMKLELKKAKSGESPEFTKLRD